MVEGFRSRRLAACMSVALCIACNDEVELGQRQLDASEPLDTGARDGGQVDASEGGPDAASCPDTPCRLVLPQCGCEDGLSCHRAMPMSLVRSCVSAGTVPVGGTCTTSLDCSAGHACVLFGGPPGTCERWCESSSDCGGTPCLRLELDDGTGWCEASCDAVDGSGCPVPKTCHLVFGISLDGVEPLPLQVCAPPSGAVEGQSCAPDGFECGDGLFCEAGQCRVLCALPGGSCSSGVCTAFDPPIDSFGYCA